ncbi:hypothetical protein FJ950_27030 [Mesorhizobium sp. B2-3-14]|uniref:hypothetical protein n=1 Tax=Mesorhizobium sp. B2-3-14 TaxID=2589950 RepID=UPI0011267DA7|nr:hypothetical protein [Mesorhizobium sp. B2-3-14]TPL79871.1 hypothetical protein FJ950_27030 [Mesorhizobium sp. B2-3-14]
MKQVARTPRSSTFVKRTEILNVRASAAALAAAGPADATLAVSEAALTALVRQAVDHPITAHGSGRWGPFEAGYDVNLNVDGGKIVLVDLGQQINLEDVSVWGQVDLRLGLNLGNVLPRICIPPVRYCVHTLWGDICTPQACVTWPSISVTVPIPILKVNLSAFFQLAVAQSGDNWDVILKVFPLSLQIDLTPTINAIIDRVREFVHRTLGGIPLIGNLIAGLLDSVINALRGIIVGVLNAIAALVRQMIILIDLFSPTIPFKIASLPSRQVILPAGDEGDGEVDLTIASVSTRIVDPEIQIAIAFA